MAKMGGPGRKRAPKGKGEADVMLRILVSRELAAASEEAAAREGISLSELWRRIGRAALLSQRAGLPE